MSGDRCSVPRVGWSIKGGGFLGWFGRLSFLKVPLGLVGLSRDQKENHQFEASPKKVAHPCGQNVSNDFEATPWFGWVSFHLLLRPLEEMKQYVQ